MAVELVEWPLDDCDESTCCHTILAMISNKPMVEIVALSKTIGLGGVRLSVPCVHRACGMLGIAVGDWQVYRGWRYVGNPFPPDCLIATWLNDGESIEMQSHVILRVDNVYYDPFHWGKELYDFPANQIPTRVMELL